LYICEMSNMAATDPAHLALSNVVNADFVDAVMFTNQATEVTDAGDDRKRQRSGDIDSGEQEISKRSKADIGLQEKFVHAMEGMQKSIENMQVSFTGRLDSLETRISDNVLKIVHKEIAVLREHCDGQLDELKHDVKNWRRAMRRWFRRTRITNMKPVKTI
jgi:hypothetical protein